MLFYSRLILLLKYYLSNNIDNCPVYSSQILQHINHHKIYWYCLHVYENVPDFTHVLVFQKILDVVTDKKR